MEQYHGTTILGVKKDGKTVIAGDGQVSLGNTIIKPNAKKVRRLGAEKVLAVAAHCRCFTVRAAGEEGGGEPGPCARAAVELDKIGTTNTTQLKP